MATTKRGHGNTKAWSYSAGERGRNRVRVFEDQRTRGLFVEFYERAPGSEEVKRRRKALGSRDRSEAKAVADRLAAEFAVKAPRPGSELTLVELFDIYLDEVTPEKGTSKQGHDRRAAAMFVRAFGPTLKARALSNREWNRFIRQRREGVVSPPGSRGRRVGDRQIEFDLRFLMAVLNWAVMAGDGHGGYLLDRNPLKGLKVPREESPRRVLLTEEEYIALRRVALEVDWRFELALVLVHETGNRIGAVRTLRWSDIDLADGCVRWRKENDKIGYERITPLSRRALEALRSTRGSHPGLGEAWVFPGPQDPSRACRGDLMFKWWNRAVKAAGLPPKERRGWHSLRRKFATDLKELPTVDLQRLGGWRSPQTLLKCYQSADERTMREALEGRARKAG